MLSEEALITLLVVVGLIALLLVLHVVEHELIGHLVRRMQPLGGNVAAAIRSWIGHRSARVLVLGGFVVAVVLMLTARSKVVHGTAEGSGPSADTEPPKSPDKILDRLSGRYESLADGVFVNIPKRFTADMPIQITCEAAADNLRRTPQPPVLRRQAFDMIDIVLLNDGEFAYGKLVCSRDHTSRGSAEIRKVGNGRISLRIDCGGASEEWLLSDPEMGGLPPD